MSDNQLNFFGEKLKLIRSKAKRTQIQMANDLNISQNVISQYENGKKKPSIDTVKIIANVYNVDMNWFFKNLNITNGDIGVLEESQAVYSKTKKESSERDLLLSIDDSLKQQTELLKKINKSKKNGGSNEF